MAASSSLDPTILFFFLGFGAVMVRSDLDVPQPIPKLLSLYLLTSIGFKGGVELSHSGFSWEIATTLLLAMGMALLVPLISFMWLKRKLDPYNAAAIAAAYGSVSAVTFATAQAYLQSLQVQAGGHMVATMALMESPAILVGIFLANRFGGEARQTNWSKLLREAFTNGSVFLMLGALLAGLLTGESGWKGLKPFLGDIYKGMLCLFLLDMGLVAAKRLGNLKRTGWDLVGFAIVMPVCSGVIAVGLARLAGFSEGNALMFAVLCGSASYIAVPAAMRVSVPQANPSLYVSLPLALTFPFNVLVGIPSYHWLITQIWKV